MKKNKEWLKKEVEEYLAIEGCYDARTALKASLEYIDQLDEPEVPVIPQFVADWIEEAKGRHHSLYQAMNEYCTAEMNQWIKGFFHSDTFARAWIDGYSVEKEKLYKVLLPGVESLDRQMYMHEETKVIGFADDGYNSRKYSKDDEFIRLFTEQEIKAIDERYWAFAEEVTGNV